MKLSMEAQWSHWSGPKRTLRIGNYTGVVVYVYPESDGLMWTWSVSVAGQPVAEGRTDNDLAAMSEVEVSIIESFFKTKPPHSDERYSAERSV